MQKLTVIVRVYDHPEYIENALDSILNQDISKDLYTILVVDDGSGQDMKDILAKYKGKVSFIRTSHVGTNHAANIGFKYTLTKYVILLDSDDYYTPTLLREMLEIAEKDNSDFVVSDYMEIKGKWIWPKKIRYISLRDNIFNGGANGILMKMDLVRELGCYDENLILPEYKLLFELQKRYKYSYIQKSLLVHRRYSGSITSNKKKVKEGINQLRDIYGEDVNQIRKY